MSSRRVYYKFPLLSGIVEEKPSNFCSCCISFATSLIALPFNGCDHWGAISTKGSTTNLLFNIRGWGRFKWFLPEFLQIILLKANRSKSSGRWSHLLDLTRPKHFSTARSVSNSFSGFRWVWIMETLFMYQFWSDWGTGALTYQPELPCSWTPYSRSLLRAAWQVASGLTVDLWARFAPRPTRIRSLSVATVPLPSQKNPAGWYYLKCPLMCLIDLRSIGHHIWL